MSSDIDYDKLAAALCRAGLNLGAVDVSSGVGVGGDGSGSRGGDLSVSDVGGAVESGVDVVGLVGSGLVGGVASVVSAVEEVPDGVVAVGSGPGSEDGGGSVCGGDVVKGKKKVVVFGSVSGESLEGSEGLAFEDALEAGSGASEVSVEIVPKHEVSDRVRRSVVFGGLGDEFPGAVSNRGSTGFSDKGFYSSVVRNDRALGLSRWLKVIGIKLPKAANVDLAVCTYTAGTMPDSLHDGKRRLRSLASVGDAALTLMLVTYVLSTSGSVEAAQALRTRVASNAYLCEIMSRYNLISLVSYPPGVDCKTTIATATAFEAILGVVTLYRTHADVCALLAACGLLK